MNQISQYDISDLVYVDETGIDENTVPDRGWAQIGKRSYAEHTGGRVERLSIVSALDMSDITPVASFEYSGTMNMGLFTCWFEQILIPKLKPGKIIILDNAKIHKSYEVLELAESAGCKVIFLPPYSPDLNPIEKFWANLKRAIKSVFRKAKNLKEAITMAFDGTFSG